jgi:hypothetical protein
MFDVPDSGLIPDFDVQDGITVPIKQRQVGVERPFGVDANTVIQFDLMNLFPWEFVTFFAEGLHFYRITASLHPTGQHPMENMFGQDDWRMLQFALGFGRVREIGILQFA